MTVGCASAGAANTTSRAARAKVDLIRSKRSRRRCVASTFGEVELGAGTDAGGPARRHRLQPRVEVYAFGTENAMRPEKRGFPAAETVRAHRHRDGHIDPHHADLDTVGEIARRIAVTGEQGGAVGEGIGVD